MFFRYVMLQIVSPLPMMIPLKTLSQSTRSERLSSKSVADLKPGMALCSLVRVCTIESINSSLVLSRGIDGDFSRMCLLLVKLSSPSQLLNTVLVRADLSKRGGGMEAPRVGGGKVVPRLEYIE